MDLGMFSGLKETMHRARLKTLYLWDGDNNINAAWMASSENSLDIFKGLIVENGVSDSSN